MKRLSEHRLRQLERLCGQLLAQNHRLIERNAELLIEMHRLKHRDGPASASGDGISERTTPARRLYRVR